MSSLKSKLEKVWFSLLLTTLICIGVSRVFQTRPHQQILQPEKPETQKLEKTREVTSSRPSTKSLSELEEENEVHQSALDKNVLFFNRVPKTGSEMLVLLMQWMQGVNGYRHVRLPGGNKRRLELYEQKMLVADVWKHVKRDEVPMSFDRHVYFTNFTEFGQKAPIFINIVRDPVDKAVSRYYYSRVTPNPLNPDIKYARSTSTLKPTRTASFEKCMQIADPECSFYSGQPYDLSIPYFCGHFRQCAILNDRWALARAKQNIEEFFPVVGVLEELNATLAVLEHKLPRFFKEVSTTYYNELLEPHKNRNRWRPRNVDPKLRQILENQLKSEYELYNWLKARLLKQARGIT